MANVSGAIMDEVEILNPNREVKIGDETIIVKEMRWGDGIAFLKKLAGNISALLIVDEKGGYGLDLGSGKLADIIVNSGDLSSDLIEKTTGKDVAWFNGLSMSEALTVLNVALELNLSSQIAKKASALGNHIQAALAGAKGAASAKSTTS